jgi:serine/threonine protein kinase
MDDQPRAPVRNHPSPDVLAAFAVGKLPESQLTIVERHVEACARCAAVVARSPHDAFVDRLLAARQPARQAPRGVPQDSGGTNLDRLPAELRDHPRYQVLRLIAEGGMSWVYLARHRVTSSLVALKTIKPEFAASGEPLERFLLEARLAGQLHHENVARVYDAEQLKDLVYIAIEYVPGQSLAQIVAETGRLASADACRYAAQVALGLQHAAEAGVVHRDVKPHNIMVDPATRTARILDFGLGRIAQENRDRSRLTRDHQILGTPDYMAPEQAKDARTADVRSDIYSLGCTLYFLLAGRPPFQASSALDLLARHETETPEPIASLRPDVPRPVASLVDRMLSKSPADRPQSPGEVAQLLLPHAAPRPAPRGSVWSDRVRAAARAAWTPAVVLPLLTALVCLIVVLAM